MKQAPDAITPEYLDTRALMIERGEITRPATIGKIVRAAAEQIRLLNVRELALEDRDAKTSARATELTECLRAIYRAVSPTSPIGRAAAKVLWPDDNVPSPEEPKVVTPTPEERACRNHWG